MNKETVSVIIRTKNRPYQLYNALKSVREQTMKNLEVIVVEDGTSCSESVIQEFRDLNIAYFNTGQSVGRCKAGNIGLERSSGHYINFLDDDDLLLPNHIEVMLDCFAKHPNIVAVHAASLERKIKFITPLKDKYRIIGQCIKYDEPFDKEKIFFQNQFPIQAVMFKRFLYEQFGGFDERLELLEDWDLWIRYSRIGEFRFVDQVTSIYHVPSDKKERFQRQEKLKKYEEIIKRKYEQYILSSNYVGEGKVQKLIKHYKKQGLVGTLRYLLYKYF